MLVRDIQLTQGDTATAYEAYKEHKEYFPLKEGQVFREGSYTASDGIHHKRNTIIYNGKEKWTKFSSTAEHTFMVGLPKKAFSGLCSHYKSIGGSNNIDKRDGIYLASSLNAIITDMRFSTVEEFTTYLSEEYDKGTPITIEYNIADEIVEPYDEAQQEAYNRLQNFMMYEGVNNISATDGLTIKVNYKMYEEYNAKNNGNIQSRPIIKITKVNDEKIDVSINGIRFKYDFKGDKYVEIDCVEKEVKYEGLNRNRQLEIDYEFPSLNIGNNEILVHSGDCIIEMKRKDRWL